MQPSNEVEASAAIHVACLHASSLNVLARTIDVGSFSIQTYANAAVKLEGAYQRALEGYHRLKNGTTQVVRIERVNIEAGAQAVIGAVRYVGSICRPAAPPAG